MSLSVGPATLVTLHFTLSLESGEIVDSTRDRQSASFCFADGNLPAGFEQTLVGMTAGQQQVHRIPPEQAFGMPNPNNIQTFPLGQFADMELTVGLVLNFADAAKAELPGVISAINDQEVEVDFNHPLAGKTLLFDVEILDVQPEPAS